MSWSQWQIYDFFFFEGGKIVHNNCISATFSILCQSFKYCVVRNFSNAKNWKSFKKKKINKKLGTNSVGIYTYNIRVDIESNSAKTLLPSLSIPRTSAEYTNLDVTLYCAVYARTKCLTILIYGPLHVLRSSPVTERDSLVVSSGGTPYLYTSFSIIIIGYRI